MFNIQSKNVDTRMAVMEEKFSIYEKMMDKLESAIHTISEINQNISRMLMVHEEKLDSNFKSDVQLTNKLNNIQEQNAEDIQKLLTLFDKFDNKVNNAIENEEKERKEDISKVHTRIESLSNKVESVTKFRWLIVGGLAVLVFVSNNLSNILQHLTPHQEADRIEKVK